MVTIVLLLPSAYAQNSTEPSLSSTDDDSINSTLSTDSALENATDANTPTSEINVKDFEVNSTINKPQDVEVQIVNGTMAHVTWTQNTQNDTTGYFVSVECEPDNKCCGPCKINIITEEPEFFFPASGLVTYKVRVRVLRNKEKSQFSKEVMTTNPNQTVPNAPDITVIPGNRSLTFGWNYGCPYTGPVQYVFNIDGITSDVNQPLSEDQCKYRFEAKDLQPFKPYDYSLLASNPSCVGTCGDITYPLEISTTTEYPNTPTSEGNSSAQEDIASTTPAEENEGNETSLTTSDSSSNDPYSMMISSSTMTPTTEEVVVNCSVCIENSSRTLPDVPGIPSEILLNLPIRFSENPDNPKWLTLEWKVPFQLNGELENFRIDFRSSEKDVNKTASNEYFYGHRSCSWWGRRGQCAFEVNISTSYEIEVRAKNKGVDEYGPPSKKNLTTDLGWPYIHGTPFKTLEVADRGDYSLHKSYPIYVNWTAFDDRFGPITSYRILKTKGREPASRAVLQYRTTPPHNNMKVFSVQDRPKGKLFVFGKEYKSNCPEGVCNAFLDPSTVYSFKFRLVSEDRYTDSSWYYFETEANVTKDVLTGMFIVLLLFVAFCIALFIVYKRFFSPIVKKGESMELPLLVPSTLDLSASKPIALNELSDTVDKLMADGQSLLKSEYQNLKACSPSKPTEEAQDGFNTSKNRYVNILPFDETRVILDEYRGIPNSDYINANYIHGYEKSKEFIACQGPREGEKEDFWRMIWEKNVHVIVMVTKLVESKTDKCCKYWPDHSASKAMYLPLSKISVKTREENPHPTDGYIYRIIQLTKHHHSLVSNSRTIKHFHYTLWPDMGVPKNPDHLIQFTSMVKKAIPDKSHHSVIHCSAGVGRTGTFIALSNLMEEMKDKDCIDVFQTVYRMRQNRVNMVQTLPQYAFIYKCVKRYAEIRSGINSSTSDQVKVPDVVTTTFSALNALDEGDDPYNQDSQTPNNSSSPQTGETQVELEPETEEEEEYIFSEPPVKSSPYLQESSRKSAGENDKSETENCDDYKDS